MNKILAVAVAVIFAGSVQLAMAKGGGAASGGSSASTVNGNGAHKLSPKKRLKKQHKRIMQGVKDGTISKSEHQQLATEGKAINQERKADLAKDGGKLNAQDRHTLEKEEDARSKQIYDDKHPDTGSSNAGGNQNGQ